MSTSWYAMFWGIYFSMIIDIGFAYEALFNGYLSQQQSDKSNAKIKKIKNDQTKIQFSLFFKKICLEEIKKTIFKLK